MRPRGSSEGVICLDGSSCISHLLLIVGSNVTLICLHLAHSCVLVFGLVVYFFIDSNC